MFKVYDKVFGTCDEEEYLGVIHDIIGDGMYLVKVEETTLLVDIGLGDIMCLDTKLARHLTGADNV